MPRYEAFTNRSFRERGMATVIITRTDETGYLQAGGVLLDLYCLGVKDAFVAEMAASEWPQKADRFIPAEERVAIHPACARKLIEGGIAYAEALGFAPHRDYRKARRVFGSVDSKACPETFAYGREGKPLYVAGPNDDQERIDRIIKHLTARLGQEGFHFMVPRNPEEMREFFETEEVALGTLNEIFDERSSGITSFEALGGLLTALEVCPVTLTKRALLDAAWAGVPPDDVSAGEISDAEAEILAYRANLGANLRTAVETDDPLLAVDFHGGLPAKPTAKDALWQRDCATDWSLGFLRATELWPDAWKAALARSDLRPHFDILREYAKPSFLAKLRMARLPADGYARQVGQAVLELYRALRSPSGPPAAGGE